MFIYNVTSQVSHAIATEWLEWMQQEHIPEVIASGVFTHHRIMRLLDTDESEGLTYVVQYFTSNREAYHKYQGEYASELRRQAQEKWGDQVFSFRTFMEVIN